MLFRQTTCVLVFFASVAFGHFTLDYPFTRGFDQDKEPTQICGGFNTPNKTRTPFPLGAAKLQISSFHVKASVFAEISFNSNPTTFSQFNTSSNGASYPQLIPFNQIPEGEACWNIDISSLGSPDAKNGTNATIFVSFDGGDGTLYQCSDIVLDSSVTIPANAIASNLTCLNAVTANSSAGASSANASATAPGGSSPSSKPGAASHLKAEIGGGLLIMSLLGFTINFVL